LTEALRTWCGYIIGKLPDDACPYSRPFPDDFRECPTFERLKPTSEESDDQPVSTTGSCVNLTVGIHWDELRHHYGRCRLGDSTARLARLKTQIADSDSYVNAHADFDEMDLGPPPIMPPR
jgi:hypothetical protein